MKNINLGPETFNCINRCPHSHQSLVLNLKASFSGIGEVILVLPSRPGGVFPNGFKTWKECPEDSYKRECGWVRGGFSGWGVGAGVPSPLGNTVQSKSGLNQEFVFVYNRGRTIVGMHYPSKRGTLHLRRYAKWGSRSKKVRLVSKGEVAVLGACGGEGWGRVGGMIGLNEIQERAKTQFWALALMGHVHVGLSCWKSRSRRPSVHASRRWYESERDAESRRGPIEDTPKRELEILVGK
ncbi:hypothetical protein BD779DRAFT_1473160 [Infundibulicybe gibba]|nr:hypothetical protein BD779DRAFT_1473160 [Infundibulicybe gibba]